MGYAERFGAKRSTIAITRVNATAMINAVNGDCLPFTPDTTVAVAIKLTNKNTSATSPYPNVKANDIIDKQHAVNSPIHCAQASGKAANKVPSSISPMVNRGTMGAGFIVIGCSEKWGQVSI